LTENIVEFIDVLRMAGIRVSISESMDAVQALNYVNALDRDQVKTSLAACLAKGEEERRIFSKSFDSFFVPPGERVEYVNQKLEEISRRKREISEEVSKLKFQEKEIRLSDEQKMVYASLTGEEKKSILDFLEKTSYGKNVRPEFRSLVEGLVHGKLNSMKQRLEGNWDPAEDIFGELPSEAGILAWNVNNEMRREKSLLYKNISGIGDADIPQVVRLIQLMVEKLKKKASRRYRRSSKKARLDIRKTIRSNLSTGAVQFRLEYKKRPKRKDKYLMLCDVSASMYRFSGFVLQFMMGMHSHAAADSYIFSEEVERLNLREFVNLPGFEQQIVNSSVWRKGTNINTAVSHILEEAHAKLNSSTIVLIVSDAKTLETDKTIEKIRVLASKVKKILWLNPVPEAEWSRIAGMEGFRRHCTMLDCSTLDRLARACEKMG
jgi:uncharacterized protein with von Willebrand factor type A (vWA) domain